MARILIVDDEAPIRRRVRELLTAAGHDVYLALDGNDGLAKLHAHKPELVLVDYIMPGLNGFQFCAAMKAMSAYRSIPVILMSGRTDRVGWRFIERFGVRDALAKPLDFGVLLTVVENVLRQERERTGQSPSEPNVTADLPMAEAFESFRVPSEPADPFFDKVSQRQPSVAMAGRLSAIALPEVLQLVSLQKRSGVLHVSRGNETVAIQIREGAVELALAEGFSDEYRIGRFIVGRELISRHDLDVLLTGHQRVQLIGLRLVSLGYISPAELKEVLASQTAEIVFEVMRWAEGEFGFVSGQRIPQAAEVGNILGVTELLMEGARRIDEWNEIESAIPSLDAVFEAVAPSASSRPSGGEIGRVFDRVDGIRTVRQIVSETSLGPFEVCRALRRLSLERLITCKSI